MTILLGIDVEEVAARLLAPRAPDATARAEEHARNVARALVPWGGQVPERIRWRTLKRGKRVRARELRSGTYVSWGKHASYAHFAAADAAANLAPSLEVGIAARLARRRGRSAEARIFERDVADAEGWERAVAKGVCVAPWPVPDICDPATREWGPLTIPAATYGCTFAELPDPFAPLLAIWELGFVLDRISEGEIELVAPSLSA